jgi:hypothetical protein
MILSPPETIPANDEELLALANETLFGDPVFPETADSVKSYQVPMFAFMNALRMAYRLGVVDGAEG